MRRNEDFKNHQKFLPAENTGSSNKRENEIRRSVFDLKCIFNFEILFIVHTTTEQHSTNITTYYFHIY